MTRWMFFKMLAAIGLGQQIRGPVSTASGNMIMYNTDMRYALDGCETKWRCGDGEERCPLGHCQKPNQWTIFRNGQHCETVVVDWEATEKETAAEKDEGIVTTLPCTQTPDTFINICSICGIIYASQVPK